MLHRLVAVADHRLERRDHVADDIFWRIVQQHGEAPRASSRGLLARANARPAARAERRRKYARPWSVRSTARPAPAHARCPRSRRRAARDRVNRAAVPTACAARRAALLFAGRRLLICACRASRTAVMAVAVDQMIVHHADRLHEGIDDGRPDELEAAPRAPLTSAAQSAVSAGVRARCRAGCLIGLPPTKSHRHVGKPGPLSMISSQARAERDRALDLGAVAHDAGVLHQPFDFFGV